MDTLVQLSDVTKQYGEDGSPAVEHVSMEVARGESVAIMGPSGSGKSTLLNLIAGLDRQTGRRRHGMPGHPDRRWPDRRRRLRDGNTPMTPVPVAGAARGGLAGRRVQAIVIGLVVLVSTGASTLGLGGSRS